MASLLLVSGLFLLLRQQPEGVLPATEMVEALLVQDELELYQQLDFYLWLERMPEAMEASRHNT